MFYRLHIVVFLFLATHGLAQTPNREWSTYHGGTNEDSFRDMAIDAAGNVYVVGSTRSMNAIITPPSSQSMIAGGSDVFLAKYDTNGNRVWATYFGGEGDDFGQSIDLDAIGNIFITGLTFSSNGIATAGTHQSFNSGNGDTFVARFSNNGAVIWGSYLGGTGFDFANDIEIDGAGNPIIIGWTSSSNGISTVGAFQQVFGGQDDVLFAKFNTNGQLQWSTYFGDIGFDTGLQVESDATGNITISGWTSSLVNIASVGTHQTTYGGNTADAFLAVFNSSGNRIWSTYYGGSGNDYADALYVTAAGDIYLSGSTNSPNNISTPSAMQSNIATGYDVFLARFSSTGFRFWATYFGGNGDDTAYRLREGNDAALYMTGYTTSTNVMAKPGAFQINKAGGQDVFLSRFEIDGSLTWSTYYGGNANDFGYGLVVDANDDIFINGSTEGSTNLSTIGAAQISYGGGTRDGFVTKFSPCTSPVLNFINSGFTCSPVNYIFELELTGQPPFTIYYNIDGVPQPPWVTNNTSFFPVVNSDQWTDIIQLDSVKSGSCLGTINSVWGFVQVRDSIRATNPVINCDPSTSTYTITVDLSGGAFGDFNSVGPNGGFINSITDRFVSLPIPFTEPYFIQFTEVGTFSNCDTITFKGVSGCVDPCPPLNINLFSNSPVCAGSPLILTGSGFVSYQWQGPNGFFSNLQNPIINSVTANNSGTYNVTVTDANDCTGVAMISVVVNQPSSGSISSNSPVCFGDSILLNVTGGVNYVWSGPNNFGSSDSNPVVVNVNAGNAGMYAVTVTDAVGCTRSASVNVAVTSQFNVQISSNSPLCENNNLVLMSSGGVAYQWSGPGGFSSNAQNPVINNVSNQRSGTYIVTVTDTNNCTASAATQVVISNLTNISLTSNAPVCIGNTIVLMASGGNGYQWSGPNGYTSTQQIPNIINATNQNAGTYTVTVTAAGGCTGTASINVLVNVLPTVLISANSPLCENNDLVLMSSGGITYQWSGPNGYNSLVQNPIVNNALNLNAGTYVVTVTDMAGCTSTASTGIVINENPDPLLTTNSPVCGGGEIIFQLSGGDSYLWQGPDNFTSIVQNPSIKMANSVNTGTYTVVVTDQNGCTTSVSTVVNVTSQVNVTVSSNSPTCEGDTLRLFSNGGSTFVWNGPNGFNTTAQNPIITSASSNLEGNYILTVTDAAGCTSTSQVDVEVKPKPMAIITGDQNVCKGEPLTLMSPNVGILRWSTNESRNTITVNPTVNSTYTLLVDDNGCKDTASIDVTVLPKPVLSLNITNSTVSLGESIQLFVSGAEAYFWSPGTGLSCRICPNPTVKPIETTTYCVKGVLNGCVADTCINITVVEDCFLIFPNIFSPNADGANDIWCSKAQDCISSQILWVYDRWGNLLHTQAGPEVCWDGTRPGYELQNQVCTFLLQIVKSDGKIENRFGSITIIK